MWWGKGGFSGGLSRTGEKTGGLDLEELRGRWRSVISLSVFLIGMACGFPGNACLSWVQK